MAKNYEIGKVVEILLENGCFAYGLVLNEPTVAFSTQAFTHPQKNFEPLFDETVFCIWVMKNALGKSGWKKVGKLENHKLCNREQQFYKFDLLTKKYSIYCDGKETAATKSECLQLECAAVWDKLHVEARLLALSEGSECMWTKSLQAESQA